MRYVTLTLMALLLLAGCASRTARVAESDVSASPATLAGTWTGVLTGTTLASAHGIVEIPARLTITDDGHWTMRTGTRGEGVSSGTLSADGGVLWLNGRMQAGTRAPVYLRLEPTEPGEMYGRADTILGSGRQAPQILLGKQTRKAGSALHEAKPGG